ncbi:MAG TPA: hypothetical protein VLE19_15500, partial [Pyrinomonadaceae bacterium]|nr:hypothetical protein [Pyrinomonadaceae bacterium]
MPPPPTRSGLTGEAASEPEFCLNTNGPANERASELGRFEAWSQLPYRLSKPRAVLCLRFVAMIISR